MKDRKKAHRTHRFQNVGGHPSDATIVYSAVTNEIKNSPISQRDMKVALDMLGKSTFGVQGKRVRHQPDVVDVEIRRTLADRKSVLLISSGGR